MSGWSEVLLGVIALSVLVMAAIQVGAVMAGLRLARRVEAMSEQINQDIKPLIANLTAAAGEASRTASMASRQAERLDELVGDVATRVDDTVRVVQHFVHGPARNGMAVVAGVRAAVSAFNGMREASRRRRDMRPRVEDEESLFIG
ncbi:MAG: hypothetical protein R2712_31250 [Vicinamibacterales bacterium]